MLAEADNVTVQQRARPGDADPVEMSPGKAAYVVEHVSPAIVSNHRMQPGNGVFLNLQ